MSAEIICVRRRLSCAMRSGGGQRAMGTNGQGDETWRRGRSSWDDRFNERDAADERPLGRSGRGAPPTPRGSSGGPDRSGRNAGAGRGAPRGKDDGYTSRAPAYDRERTRGYDRADDRHAPDAGRTARRPRADAQGGSDNPATSMPRGRQAPNRERGEAGASYGRSPGREAGREPYSDRSARPAERAGERSMRGQRPPMRDDTWDLSQQRTRANPAPAGGMSGSDPRSRMPGRGAAWDDAQSTQRRRRPNMDDPRNRPPVGRPPLDPRGMRGGLASLADEEDLPSTKGGFTAGKAILIILLMLVVGAGAAYGYFRISTPAIHGSTAPIPAGTTTPTTSPGAKSTSTPHTAIPASSASRVVFVADGKNI